MRIGHVASGLLALAALLGPWAGAGAGEDAKAAPPALTDKTFERLRHEILATKEECSFETIPWKATFWDAVVEAQATERPVLLWAMNGHPLGCT